MIEEADAVRSTAPSAFMRIPKRGDMPSGSAKFELTDKSIDFLGFRLLRQLLAFGRSSFGRHETATLRPALKHIRQPRIRIGDHAQLDISSTLLHCRRARGLAPAESRIPGLMSASGYESSCSTVLLLDTSHSMILYVKIDSRRRSVSRWRYRI